MEPNPEDNPADMDMKRLSSDTSAINRGPFRKRSSSEHEKNGEGVDEIVKVEKRLCTVEKELSGAKDEIKRLKLQLNEADKERNEMAGTVSSMYVQIQYWNAWLGKFSSRLTSNCEKGAKGTQGLEDLESLTEAMKCKAIEDNSVNFHQNHPDIDQKGKISDLRKQETVIKEPHAVEGSESADSVADMLKETAENAFASTGMSYDEKSGLYYDWNSHMYYDPKTHLFYDNDNGIYYYYDNVKGSYVFYSQVDIKNKKEGGDDKSECGNDDKSEGELSSTESESDPDSAPCIRAIVTKSETMKEGTLYLVTCSGVTIGRDKKHMFCVPDKDVSKDHAEIKYVEEGSRYVIRDKGSVNGTFLNDKRISEQKKESNWAQVNHKDFLKVGSTVFVLHMHQKQETCDGCEPGQVQSLLIESKPVNYSTFFPSKERDRKKKLKELKNKYHIDGDGLKQALKTLEDGNYKDRANKRRKNIGSEPIINDRNRRETKASVKKRITSENKGHQMMQKMGWKVGEGLGRQSTGITEPINVVVREKNKGLGTGVTKAVDENERSVNFKWKKAKQRYDDIVQHESSKNDVQEDFYEDFDF